MGLSPRGPLTDARGELSDLLVGTFPFLHAMTNLVGGVDHGGVVAAPETFSDLGEGEVGELSADVHRDLACVHKGPRP